MLAWGWGFGWVGASRGEPGRGCCAGAGLGCGCAGCFGRGCGGWDCGWTAAGRGWLRGARMREPGALRGRRCGGDYGVDLLREGGRAVVAGGFRGGASGGPPDPVVVARFPGEAGQRGRRAGVASLSGGREFAAPPGLPEHLPGWCWGSGKTAFPEVGGLFGLQGEPAELLIRQQIRGRPGRRSDSPKRSVREG